MKPENKTKHDVPQSHSTVGLGEDLSTLNWKCTSDHYKALFERHMAESTRYQALLYHSWKSLREQQKGLRRQSQKIKRLKNKITELEKSCSY